jgi:hypothetical protein
VSANHHQMEMPRITVGRPSIIIIQRQPLRPAMPSMWPMLEGGMVLVGWLVGDSDSSLVMAVMNLPIGEDPTQRAGDGRGDEEVADPQGVFALCVEEGEVDGLLVDCQSSSPSHAYPYLIDQRGCDKKKTYCQHVSNSGSNQRSCISSAKHTQSRKQPSFQRPQNNPTSHQSLETLRDSCQSRHNPPSRGNERKPPRGGELLDHQVTRQFAGDVRDEEQRDGDLVLVSCEVEVFLHAVQAGVANVDLMLLGCFRSEFLSHMARCGFTYSVEERE